MTEQTHYTVPTEWLELIQQQGWEALPQLLTIVINAAMRAERDAALEAWRTRPLGECPYLVLDARYEQVRTDGQVRDAAVLIAIGVDRSGKRAVLGVSVSLSEAEAHWRSFLSSLVQRGVSG